MTIESQLERICVALEALATIYTGPVSNNTSEVKPKAEPKTPTKNAAEPEKPKEAPKAETKQKEEPKSSEGAVTLEDLAAKVKVLASEGGRDAVMEVFGSFKVARLTEFLPEQYVLVDIALAKAITKAKAASQEE